MRYENYEYTCLGDRHEIIVQVPFSNFKMPISFSRMDKVQSSNFQMDQIHGNGSIFPNLKKNKFESYKFLSEGKFLDFF